MNALEIIITCGGTLLALILLVLGIRALLNRIAKGPVKNPKIARRHASEERSVRARMQRSRPETPTKPGERTWMEELDRHNNFID